MKLTHDGGRWHNSGHVEAYDRAAIFSGILARNALRKGFLPRLDVTAVYRREVEQAEWRAHVAAHREAARAEVLREQRRRHGSDYPQSAGGRWAVNILTAQALRRSFDAQRSQ